MNGCNYGEMIFLRVVTCMVVCNVVWLHCLVWFWARRWRQTREEAILSFTWGASSRGPILEPFRVRSALAQKIKWNEKQRPAWVDGRASSHWWSSFAAPLRSSHCQSRARLMQTNALLCLVLVCQYKITTTSSLHWITFKMIYLYA